MVQTICLSKEAYLEFIENELFKNGYTGEFNDLAGWVQQSKTYFDIQFVGYNYFLSQHLEVYMRRGKNCSAILEFIYSLEDKMLFTIQEFDHHFIDRLMGHLPNELNTLEQDLLEVIEIIHE